MAADRVSTAFHETIPLNLPVIAGILELAIEKGGDVSDSDLKSQVMLGNNYIKSMPRYARAAGLLEMSGYHVTKFGEKAFKFDPNLTSVATQWLMHYHLSAPHGPGPLFWNYVITKAFRVGEKISSSHLGEQISGYLETEVGDKLKTRTTKDSATAILRTYTRYDGLGRLGMLSEQDEKAGVYIVNEAEAPSSSVLGYALADFWDNNFGERKSINLSEVTGASGFLSIFFIGPGLLSSRLSDLQSEGLLQLQRVAPPHQLVRLWRSKEQLLEKVYE